MSVYTSLNDKEILAFVQLFGVTSVTRSEAIRAGVTNSNYFVYTPQGDYVLTVFEQVADDEVTYNFSVALFWQTAGIACPSPVTMTDGGYVGQLAGKPATLVKVFPGQSLTVPPTPSHCFQVGQVLGRLHRLKPTLPVLRSNTRGLSWMQQTVMTLQDTLAPDIMSILNKATAFLDSKQNLLASLPKGLIHADLFTDNVLFANDCLSAIIDFDFVCYDWLLLDLAIVTNDWCVIDGQVKPDNFAALIRGYQTERQLTVEECDAWQVVLQFAALRFWLSRLSDAACFTQSADLLVKEPAPFEQLWRLHAQQASGFCL